MKLFTEIAKQLPQFCDMLSVAENSGKSPFLLTGLGEIHKAHFVFAANDIKHKTQLVITPDEPTASALCENINAMAGEQRALLYPERDFNLREAEAVSREYEQIRIGVLSKLAAGDAEIIAASAEAALQYTMPPSELLKRSFAITFDSQIDTTELTQKLIECGYEKTPQVEGRAQFSVRGGIVDIFPPNLSAPVRIELWGDSIDTMSVFDIESQRRTEEISRINITPACEVLFLSQGELAAKIEDVAKKEKNAKTKEKLEADIRRINSGVSLFSTDKYLRLAYQKPATLFDYINDGILYISEYAAVAERIKNSRWQFSEDIKALLEEGEISGSLAELNAEIPKILSEVQRLPSVFFDTFTHSNRGIAFGSMAMISPVQTGCFSGELKLLSEDTEPVLEDGGAVVLLAGTKKAANSAARLMQEQGLPAEYTEAPQKPEKKRIIVTSGSLTAGFEYPEINVSVISMGRAADAAKQRQSRFKKGQQLKSLTDLSRGDFVVHISHGIGVFQGIQKLDIQGVTKDYIKIAYKGSDILYVPVTQLDMVSRYIGAGDDGNVKLNSLHTAEWQKTRARAKAAVSDMADELIALYSKRLATKGYAFSPDTEWQKDFEQRFPYTETEDQLRCTEEIKEDMEKEHPMDRVLCGDVGFGKTEVAMRACFKCVMDGKQCAILCPTTILAWQHYQSFLKRFEGFPINIEVLSRFRTPKQQKEIIKKLASGEIDIIIGTHRLVQKDVSFKDLGFAVVDEEQRFGVKHKERFKEMFTNVDMLTLSATPIPRTLNMAISGIRDMSTIEQAPQDRHPVQSYVLEQDNGIIADAVKKELRRGGQVYYIHNNIESIELCAARIQKSVPEARIATAHGRMDEKELSEIWRKLIDHEIDVLVCTTIIETGVDVANCNTLVVENADRMGLSQLYQLRGRVGRSGRRAFAYFTFVRGKVLSEIATKRLEAIREFTRFGSGFRIAMRDLEIRGAGSILGARQHGHMEAVGYDMYLRLLSEAVAERKGEAPSKAAEECVIDIRTDAHIPEEYIAENSQRIDIYKKIAAIKTNEDKMDVTDELIDRFGEPPKAVLSLLEAAYLRNMLASRGFCEISQKPQGLLLYMQTFDMETAGRVAAAFKDRAMVNASTKPYVIIKPKRGEKLSPIDELRRAVAALEEPKE